MGSVQLRFAGPSASAAADGVDVEAPLVDLEEVPGEPGIFFFRAVGTELGTSTVQVLIDGQPLAQDPTYVRVTPRVCLISGRIVTSDARGVCHPPRDPPNSVRITSIVVPTCGFAFIVLAVCLTRRITIATDAAKWAKRDEEERKLKLALQTLLARADSEKDILTATLDAVQKVLPEAVGVAAGVFRDELCTSTSIVEGVATSLEGQLALLSSLPEDVGVFREGPGDRQSSVWHACDNVASADGDGRATDSREFNDGINRFSDWAEARRLGLEFQRAVTAAISAEDVVLGFVSVHLPTRKRGKGEHPEAVRILMEIAQIVGSALFVRRALVGVGVNTKGLVDEDQQTALLSAAAAAGLDEEVAAAGHNGGNGNGSGHGAHGAHGHGHGAHSGAHHGGGMGMVSAAALAVAALKEGAAHSGKRRRPGSLDGERPPMLKAMAAQHAAAETGIKANDDGEYEYGGAWKSSTRHTPQTKRPSPLAQYHNITGCGLTVTSLFPTRCRGGQRGSDADGLGGGERPLAAAAVGPGRVGADGRRVQEAAGGDVPPAGPAAHLPAPADAPCGVPRRCAEALCARHTRLAV